MAIYPMTYDAERNLATWTEGDQPHTATVIALPDGSTGLRLVSPQAELRCLTCGTVEFKVRATGTVWIKVERVELAKLVTVPLSIELDTEEGTVTAVKVLDQRAIRPPAFTARAATAPMPTCRPAGPDRGRGLAGLDRRLAL